MRGEELVLKADDAYEEACVAGKGDTAKAVVEFSDGRRIEVESVDFENDTGEIVIRAGRKPQFLPLNI
jgi:hypothetical protein